LDFRADLYAFGASLYHMVTGQVPFDGETAREVMIKHLKEQLVPPEKVNPRISEGLSKIIRVCLAKVPDDRYDSTADLVADLEAVAMGEMPLKASLKLEGAIDENEEKVYLPRDEVNPFETDKSQVNVDEPP